MTQLQPITNASNPLVKEARALRQKKARAEMGLFLAEGILPVGEAVEAGWDVQTILYAPEILTGEFAQSLLERAAQKKIRVQAISRSVMESLAEKDNPQGLLAVVRQKKLTLNDIAPQTFRLGAACVAPQDPGNVGTILRTLDAVGADGLILLDGGVDPYHPSVVRASMGTLFWKPIVQSSFDTFQVWARENAYRLIGASAHASADYRTVQRSARTILLLGSEQKGLTREQLSACDLTVALPMKGRASSLNLAVAAGVLLYALSDAER
jgi:TrmH family RNA methyltransferase